MRLDYEGVSPDNKDKKLDQILIDLNSVKSITSQNDSGGLMTITDRKLMERFVEAIHTAEYSIAQLDIAAPDYTAVVATKDGEVENFSFWLKGEHEGLFIKSGQNGHFKLSATSKTALLDLLQPKEQQMKSKNLLIDEDIKLITLTKSLSQGTDNSGVVITEYAKNEVIEIFVKAINSAEQMPGILNRGLLDIWRSCY